MADRDSLDALDEHVRQALHDARLDLTLEFHPQPSGARSGRILLRDKDGLTVADLALESAEELNEALARLVVLGFRADQATPSRSSAPASARAVPSRSEPTAPSSDTSTARSAPMASAFRSESTAFSGPSDTSTTSPPCASLMRSASSTAFTSVAFSAPSPDRSSRFVAASTRLTDVASGTCFTHTAIFTA